MNATRPAASRTVAPIANPHAEHQIRDHARSNAWRRGSRLEAWRDPAIPADIWLSFVPVVRHYPR